MSGAEEPRINIEHVDPMAPRPPRQKPSQSYSKQILIVTGGFFAAVAIGFGMDTSVDFLRRQFSGWSSPAFASGDVPACSDPSVTEVIANEINSQIREFLRYQPKKIAREFKLSNIREDFYNKLAKSRRCIAEFQVNNDAEMGLLTFYNGLTQDIRCRNQYIYEIRYNKRNDNYDFKWNCLPIDR